jgi:hypothetical protein
VKRGRWTLAANAALHLLHRHSDSDPTDPEAPMFRPADYALTEVERNARHVALTGSLGACKDLAEACSLWCVERCALVFHYAGVTAQEVATIRPWDKHRWVILVPSALLEEIP